MTTHEEPGRKLRVALQEFLGTLGYSARGANGLARRFMNERWLPAVTPSCGCIFCDLDVDLNEDAMGFHHVGPNEERLPCPLQHRAPPDGFVSVELLNIERPVCDDLRERNAKLRELAARRATQSAILVALLREARQYISDAGSDEDGETQRNSALLLTAIDTALEQGDQEVKP